MTFAKVGEVKVGDHLCADVGFTCLAFGAVREVCADDTGLYIGCSHGRHYLIGQLVTITGEYIGLTKVQP